MEKSLGLLAAVVLLGGFLDTVLKVDASTDTYLRSNNRTTTTAEPVTVEDHRRHPLTPTTAPSKLSTTTARDKLRDGKTSSKGREEENNKEEEKDDSAEDEKTKLGRTQKTFNRSESWLN